MESKNKTEKYVEYLNSHILPFIDYTELQNSYGTNMIYAKGILNRLHEAMVKIYGSECFDEPYSNDGLVVIPGVVRGINSGKMCIVLLELDLSSSCEHWGTSFLCKYGVIGQEGNEAVSNNDKVLKSEVREVLEAHLPYDYCYTASIPNDFHVVKAQLPKELKAILDDYQNHRAVLQFEHEELVSDKKHKIRNTRNGKPSVIQELRRAAQARKESKKERPLRNKTKPER
jgi:hypothetical protein